MGAGLMGRGREMKSSLGRWIRWQDIAFVEDMIDGERVAVGLGWTIRRIDDAPSVDGPTILELKRNGDQIHAIGTNRMAYPITGDNAWVMCLRPQNRAVGV